MGHLDAGHIPPSPVMQTYVGVREHCYIEMSRLHNVLKSMQSDLKYCSATNGTKASEIDSSFQTIHGPLYI